MQMGGRASDLARLIRFMPSSFGSRKSVNNTSKCWRSSKSMAVFASSARYTSYRSSSAARSPSRVGFSSSTIKSVGVIPCCDSRFTISDLGLDDKLKLHGGIQQPGPGFMQWQPDPEGRAPAQVALKLDPSAMGSDDALHDHQAQAGAFFLRGIERFEDAVDLLLWDASAGIRHADPDAIGTFSRLQREGAALGHGLESVLDEIHQDLLDLGGVHGRQRQGLCQPRFYIESAVIQLRPQQLQRLFHDLVEGSWF